MRILFSYTSVWYGTFPNTATFATKEGEMQKLMLLVTLLILSSVCVHGQSVLPSPTNPVQVENNLPGTSDWQLTRPSQRFVPETGQEIKGASVVEGFTRPLATNRGGDVFLYVNSTDPFFTVEVYRMGWYGGLGARKMLGPITLPRLEQPKETLNTNTLTYACPWQVNITLKTVDTQDPSKWLSGVYLAKFTGIPAGQEKPIGVQSYALFVVREDGRSSEHLFQLPTNTYEMYNNWGGYSGYSFNSVYQQGRAVSFDRPFVTGYGASDFMRGWSGWEHNILNFLEREGVDVTYCTNTDVAQYPTIFQNHRTVIFAGHDEYWSYEQRQNVEAAETQGLNLIFLGADIGYWKVRPGGPKEKPDYRLLVGYKQRIAEDPERNDFTRSTGKWRETINTTTGKDLAESRLSGVMNDDPLLFLNTRPAMQVANAQYWVFANTAVHNGENLPDLIGHEADRVFSDFLPISQLTMLAHSPTQQSSTSPTVFSDMVAFQTTSGSWVFSCGTLWWSAALDDYITQDADGKLRKPVSARTKQVVRQITRNVLARFTNKPLTQPGATGVVSAASYAPNGPLAADSLAVAFTDAGLHTTPTGTSVWVTDSNGTKTLSEIFFASSGQVNFLIPAGLANGDALVEVMDGDGHYSSGRITLSTIAPGTFSANASGKEVAAAVVVRLHNGVQSFEPVAVYDPAQSKWVPLPIDLAGGRDLVYLILFGTGLRGETHITSFSVKLGTEDVSPTYAGTQGGFKGLDQINVQIPKSLAGKGLINVVVTANGQKTNPVTISIK